MSVRASESGAEWQRRLGEGVEVLGRGGGGGGGGVGVVFVAMREFWTGWVLVTNVDSDVDYWVWWMRWDTIWLE